jgi:transcriptional regulator GlxA family with amidase domain
VTSAGSAAGLDACLHLLRRDHGPRTANAVARALVVAPQRAHGQTQFVDRPVPHLAAGDTVARASGFAGGMALRPHFRRLVGVSPQAYRASSGWPETGFRAA